MKLRKQKRIFVVVPIVLLFILLLKTGFQLYRQKQIQAAENHVNFYSEHYPERVQEYVEVRGKQYLLYVQFKNPKQALMTLKELPQYHCQSV